MTIQSKNTKCVMAIAMLKPLLEYTWILRIQDFLALTLIFSVLSYPWDLMMIITFDPWPLACILQSKSSSSQEGPFKGKARTRWKWEIYLLYIEQLLKEFVSVVVNNEHNLEICWKIIHMHRNRDIKKWNTLLYLFWDFLLYNCWVTLSNM